jgi:hypothetical protein
MAAAPRPIPPPAHRSGHTGTVHGASRRAGSHKHRSTLPNSSGELRGRCDRAADRIRAASWRGGVCKCDAPPNRADCSQSDEGPGSRNGGTPPRRMLLRGTWPAPVQAAAIRPPCRARPLCMTVSGGCQPCALRYRSFPCALLLFFAHHPSQARQRTPTTTGLPPQADPRDAPAALAPARGQ